MKSKWLFVVYMCPLQLLGYTKLKTFVAYLKFKSDWGFIWQPWVWENLGCFALAWRLACFVRRWVQARLRSCHPYSVPIGLHSGAYVNEMRLLIGVLFYHLTRKWMQKLTLLAAEILDNFRDLMCTPFHVTRTTGQSFWTGCRTYRVCIWRFPFPLFSLVTWSWSLIYSIWKSQSILAFSSPEHPGSSFLNAWSLSLCQVVTRGGVVCMWEEPPEKTWSRSAVTILTTLSVSAAEPWLHILEPSSPYLCSRPLKNFSYHDPT